MAAAFSVSPGNDTVFTVEENQPVIGPAITVTGNDVVGNVTFSLPLNNWGGLFQFNPDNDLFSIDSVTGEVSISARDFEDPKDDGWRFLWWTVGAKDNTYIVNIRVEDEAGNNQEITWNLVIEDVLEGDEDNDGVPSRVEKAEGTDHTNGQSYKDTDSDGTPDYLEQDSDNDLISNLEESAMANPYGDNDNDDIPNYLDKTDKGDGSENECTASADGKFCVLGQALASKFDYDQDGTANFQDLDSDADGLLDRAEGLVDFDNDNIANYLDIDSDGDGIPDVKEARLVLLDDGFNHLDSDEDGISDSIEGTLQTDSDNDGIDDYYDVDIQLGPDTNKDGINDDVLPPDLDGDGTPNYLDEDSDSDGLLDIDESAADFDNDNIANHLDKDCDNDFVPDVIEQLSCTDTTVNHLDRDGDGIPDVLEAASSVDTDGDGIDDYFDIDLPFNDQYSDANGDGIADFKVPYNFDGDTLADYLDPDSDDDSILDTLEEQLLVADVDDDGINDKYDVDFSSGIDANGDGVIENNFIDTDQDGFANFRDLDTDNDSVPDIAEVGSPDREEDGIADEGFISPTQNVLAARGVLLSGLSTDGVHTELFLKEIVGLDTLKPGQVDTTGDSDNDGIDNSVDTAPYSYGLKHLDNDNDGVTDYLDMDDDGDGIPDVFEGGVNGDIDVDGDGIVNRLDTDSDGDGISDTDESQLPEHIGDSNANGVDDSLESVFTGGEDSDNNGLDDALLPADTDGDGRPDFMDNDSDNDGFQDHIELNDKNDDGVSDHLQHELGVKTGGAKAGQMSAVFLTFLMFCLLRRRVKLDRFNTETYDR